MDRNDRKNRTLRSFARTNGKNRVKGNVNFFTGAQNSITTISVYRERIITVIIVIIIIRLHTLQTLDYHCRWADTHTQQVRVVLPATRA